MSQMQHDFDGGPVARDFSTLLGTPFKVFLSGGVSEHIDTKTGEIDIEITDAPGLIAAIVQARALHPRKLSGDDLKFIRSALCLRSNEVAVAIDASPEHYSRCETGAKTLSADKEKFYRMYVCLAAIFKDKSLQEKLSKEYVIEKSMNSPSKEKTHEAMKAFRKIFLDLKLDYIHPIEDEIEFHFYRHEIDMPTTCGDDGKWTSEEDTKEAA